MQKKQKDSRVSLTELNRANVLQLTTTAQFTYNCLVNKSTHNLPHQISKPKQSHLSQIFKPERKYTNEMHKRKWQRTTLIVA